MQNSKGFEAGMRLGLAYLEKTAFEELSDFEKEAFWRGRWNYNRATKRLNRSSQALTRRSRDDTLFRQLQQDPSSMYPNLRRMMLLDSTDPDYQAASRVLTRYRNEGGAPLRGPARAQRQTQPPGTNPPPPQVQPSGTNPPPPQIQPSGFDWVTPAAITAGAGGVGYGIGQATKPVPQPPSLRQRAFG